MRRAPYIEVDPFPFCTWERFLVLDVLQQINNEWPKDPDAWKPYHHANSQKWACFNPERFGPRTKEAIDFFNRPQFVESLGDWFCFPGLVADPGLFGGGLHESFTGGFLGIHADFNIHPETKLIRRLNLLLFLNEPWPESYGGALELWTKTERRRSFLPEAGRCVIFETSDKSFHGHPEPLTCPTDRSRRSIALYYYSPAKEGESIVPHSTLYLGDEANWPEALVTA